jgi:hypothetical protein
MGKWRGKRSIILRKKYSCNYSKEEFFLQFFKALLA